MYLFPRSHVSHSFTAVSPYYGVLYQHKVAPLAHILYNNLLQCITIAN